MRFELDPRIGALPLPLGVYTEFDENGLLERIEFSPRSYVMFHNEVVFDDDSEDQIADMTKLFGDYVDTMDGRLFANHNVIAWIVGGRVESLSIFTPEYRLRLRPTS
jgi:hypothetical protein